MTSMERQWMRTASLADGAGGSAEQGALGWRPALALIVLGLACNAMASLLRPTDWATAGGLILLSGAILLPGVVAGFRRKAADLLVDHFHLLSLAFLVYFVGGALLVPFGPRATVEYALAYFPVDAPGAARAMAVNDLGLGLALLVGAAWRRPGLQWFFRREVRIGRPVSEGVAILLFAAIGGVASIGVALWDLGFSQQDLVPGSQRLLGQLLNVAVLLAAARRGAGAFAWRILAVLLALVQSALGLVLLSKTIILLPWVALVLGLALRWGIRRALVPGIAGIALLFTLLGNPILQARTRFGLEGPVRDVRERLYFLSRALSRRDTGEEIPFQAWSRICYLPAQGAALDLRDRGRGGEDFASAGWVVLPRVLFAGKPRFSAAGREFEQKVTGFETSSSSPGVFADGYYNLGWPGVVLVGLALGALLSCTSTFAREVFRARRFLWLPMALLGCLMAYRVDGTFISDILGPFVVFGYLLLGLALAVGMGAKQVPGDS